MSKKPHRLRLAAESDLAEGHTIKFYFQREGIRIEGFLVRHHGKIVAFENLCRHLPLTLDYGDNQFFTPDGKHLICNTHNAIYEPLTGLCIQGPCMGASLHPLEIESSEGSVWLIQSEAQ